jgi:hypothetical protein
MMSAVGFGAGASWLWGWYLVLVAIVFVAAIVSSTYLQDRRWRR